MTRLPVREAVALSWTCPGAKPLGMRVAVSPKRWDPVRHLVLFIPRVGGWNPSEVAAAHAVAAALQRNHPGMVDAAADHGGGVPGSFSEREGKSSLRGRLRRALAQAPARTDPAPAGRTDQTEDR